MTSPADSKRRVFASDVHLCPEHPERTERFFAWLDDHIDAERIYLIGDLFDLWVGRRQSRIPFYRDIVERFAAAVAAGARIEFVHGNRDFLIDDQFAAETGMGVHEDPMPADFDPSLMLTHGDLLCTSDLGYQRSRKFLRGRTIRFLSVVLPLRATLAIGDWMRRYSARSVAQKPRKVLEPPVDGIYRLAEYEGVQYATVLCGHMHRPHRRMYERDGHRCELVVLGAWEDSGSYAVHTSTGLRLFVGEGDAWCEVAPASRVGEMNVPGDGRASGADEAAVDAVTIRAGGQAESAG